MLSYDFILIVGAPGSGKSTIALGLQKCLKSPMFEFGWIPEFRRLDIPQSYEEEEQISMENLLLVSKNYLEHGYKNIDQALQDNEYWRECKLPNQHKINTATKTPKDIINEIIKLI